ncbi:uncharacterized protein V1516DRAFT_374371 [Lipomyces oligophaga]|uniref:uncharacterized protein n=1 Tax=Lipomyces oligophaga TaxID=45792 RepID=UPI0034CD986E
MATDFSYDQRPKARKTLVPPATAVSMARALVAEMDQTWTRGPAYNAENNRVQTYTRFLYGEKWFARLSVHDEPWEWFDYGLLRDHTENECDYISSLESFTEFYPTDDLGWRGVHLIFKFIFPLSRRDIAEYILAVQPDPAVREFFVLSVPADEPVTPGHVKGQYSSIERVVQLDNGQIQWTMATVGGGGGPIPKPIQDIFFPRIIANNVPSFLSWARRRLTAEQIASRAYR